MILLVVKHMQILLFFALFLLRHGWQVVVRGASVVLLQKVYEVSQTSAIKIKPPPKKYEEEKLPWIVSY